MQLINDISDVSLFRGCIVAFENFNSNYYKDDGDYHSINNKTFAYINIDIGRYQGDHIGYPFSVLYNNKNNKNKSPSICHDSITSNNTQRQKLRVQLATEDEIEQIKSALSLRQVRFASGDYHLTEILNTDPVPERPWSKVAF